VSTRKKKTLEKGRSFWGEGGSFLTQKKKYHMGCDSQRKGLLFREGEVYWLPLKRADRGKPALQRKITWSRSLLVVKRWGEGADGIGSCWRPKKVLIGIK